jgi:hypothetical protein
MVHGRVALSGPERAPTVLDGAGISRLTNGNVTQSIYFGSVQRLNFFVVMGQSKRAITKKKTENLHIDIALAGDACSRSPIIIRSHDLHASNITETVIIRSHDCMQVTLQRR